MSEEIEETKTIEEASIDERKVTISCISAYLPS